MSLLPRSIAFVLVAPLLAIAADRSISPLVTKAETSGIDFANPIEITFELKVAKPDQINPDFKSILIANNFNFTLAIVVSDRDRVSTTTVTAKRSGPFERGALSALVNRVEATATGAPGALKWSISQRSDAL